LVAGCLDNHELFREVEASSAGGGGGGPAARSPAGGPCNADQDCVSTTWCADRTCTPCPPSTRCRARFSAVTRNGCTWCAPPNECLKDSECGEQMLCYAGAQCAPGCDPADPACCFGNLCGDPNCGPPTDLDCSVVGCSDGGMCVGTAKVEDCECDEETQKWLCATSTGQNQCQLQQ
jgi:hypothetical protein